MQQNVQKSQFEYEHFSPCLDNLILMFVASRKWQRRYEDLLMLRLKKLNKRYNEVYLMMEVKFMLLNHLLHIYPVHECRMGKCFLVNAQIAAKCYI